MMGIPAGVLQVQRCEQDLNVPQFELLGFSQSRQCNQRHKNNLLWVCERFCLCLLKRLLIRLVCHRIIKMKLKLVKLFSFSINVLLSFSFLPQNGSLMKTFLHSSKRKSGMMLSSCGESVRKLVIVCEIKRF